MTTTTADAPAIATARPKLFAAPNWPLALGAVALVTLGAFENRAVNTALPTVVAEFHALGAFGLVNAAPVATFLISLAITGLWCDRRGPVPALRTGVATFALAQLIVGTAGSMPMVVAGRLLSGLAEGLIDIALMVLIARALPEVLRARMFSLFAAAWVLPSVLGPAVTGLVTETAGWRWVFLGALAMLVPAWAALQPAIRLARKTPARTVVDGPVAQERWRTIVPAAVGAAAASFFLTLAGDLLDDRPFQAIAIIGVSLLVLAVTAVKLMPAGTFGCGCGFPTVLLLRASTAAAFGGVGAFLPLLLTMLHGFGPSLAGISLTITGVMWATGSWLQGRDHKLSRVAVLRAGMAAMTVGLAVATTLAWTGLPVLIGLAGWAIAGLGMGLSSPTLALLTLDLAGEHNQGRYTSAGQMAASISTAATFAITGTLMAFAAPDPGRVVFGVILTGGAVVALLGLLVTGRVVPQD
jgi:MFS family permease